MFLNLLWVISSSFMQYRLQSQFIGKKKYCFSLYIHNLDIEKKVSKVFFIKYVIKTIQNTKIFESKKKYYLSYFSSSIYILKNKLKYDFFLNMQLCILKYYV